MERQRSKNQKGNRRTIFKLTIVSIDDMDRFLKKEMKKIRPVKNTWYDWLIDFIPDPIRKSVGGFKHSWRYLGTLCNKRRKKRQKSE